MNKLSGPAYNYNQPLKNPSIISSKIIITKEDGTNEEFYDFTSNNIFFEYGLSFRCHRLITENDIKYLESIYNYKFIYAPTNTSINDAYNYESNNIKIVGNILHIDVPNLDYRYQKTKYKSSQKNIPIKLNHVKFEFTLSNLGVQIISNIINISNIL